MADLYRFRRAPIRAWFIIEREPGMWTATFYSLGLPITSYPSAPEWKARMVATDYRQGLPIVAVPLPSQSGEAA